MIRVSETSENVIAMVFCDNKGIIFVDFLKGHRTGTGNYSTLKEL